MNNTNNATQWAGGRNIEGHDRKKQEEKKLEGLPCTTEELQMLLQAEGDRRVAQALKTASEKWQKELQGRAEAERAEAQRLAGLSLEKLEQEMLERCARELDEKERALRKKELELKIIYLLAESKLPLELKDFISGSDEKKAMDMAQTLIRLWREKIGEAVRGNLSCYQHEQG